MASGKNLQATGYKPHALIMFIALTPNPALDRTLTLEQPLKQGQLHRVSQVKEVAGGKGLNVARVLKTLGAEVVVAGFLGGWNGQKFRALLEREGLTGIFEDVEGETRECQILLDHSGHPTEVYERGARVTLSNWQALIKRLPKGKVIVSGSFASGLADNEIPTVLSALGTPVFDGSGKALRAAIRQDVLFIKPNASELAQLLNKSEAGVKEARELYQKHGAPILLTLGAEGAAYIGERVYVAKAPRIEVLNPVGSGDSLLAAFVWAQGEGYDLEDALRFGVAAGSDNARNGGGGNVSVAGIEALARAVQVETAS